MTFPSSSFYDTLMTFASAFTAPTRACANSQKAGVVVDGKFEKTTKGCPQGSPLSPMLSTIVLNELDHELEARGHRYCRWADDFLILVKSERAAKRAMENTTRFLEEGLNLPVNKEKSEVALVKEVPFLGFQVLRGKIRLSTKSRERFKEGSRTNQAEQSVFDAPGHPGVGGDQKTRKCGDVPFASRSDGSRY